jgi:Asp/Glu/hydantoin racemase
MTNYPDRTYDIAAAVAKGEPLADLAEMYGLRPSRIRVIAKENAAMVERCRGRSVPPGLTARAALAIEDAIGIWPTVAQAAEITGRRMDILRSHAGRRVIMEDIDRWLDVSTSTASSKSTGAK